MTRVREVILPTIAAVSGPATLQAVGTSAASSADWPPRRGARTRKAEDHDAPDHLRQRTAATAVIGVDDIKRVHI